MGIGNRRWAAAALAGLLLAGGAAWAIPEGGKPAVPASRIEKLKKLYQKLGYEELARSAAKSRIRTVLRWEAKRAEEACANIKWEPVDDFFLRDLGTRIDDRTLDEVLPLLDTPDGRRMLSLVRLNRATLPIDIRLTLEARDPAVGEFADEFGRIVEKAFEDSAPAATAEMNETAAIAGMRNLVVAQAMIQSSGRVDCDQDGIGEYGTLLEMTGIVGVRAGFSEGPPPGSDFLKQGKKMNPSILPSAFSAVDENGIVTRRGYCFRVFLPDTGRPPAVGFVHEKGPAAAIGLDGGTGRVGVDFAETRYCAYAWPEKKGTTGIRVFFVNETGDVMQSANDVAGWSGTAKAPPGNSAFSGPGMVSDVAVDRKGNDGDVWKSVF